MTAIDREIMRQRMATVTQHLKTGVHVLVANQLFPTPPALALRMVELVAPQPGERVLEPSAGTGSLLRAVLQAEPSTIRTAVEISHSLSVALRRIDPGAHVFHVDFLTWQSACDFDAIVMNPPFERGADIAHVRHALSMLKPDGRLAAICAGGPRQREQLVPLVLACGGAWEALPAGTFIEQGTNVSTLLLTVGCTSGGAA